MGDLKSLLALWRVTCVTVAGDALDPRSVEYVVRRTTSEGIRFLTTSLPLLAKALLPVFQGSAYKPPEGFSLKGPHMPTLLSELFTDILSEDGKLRLDRSEGFLAKRVQQINQICYFAYKLEVKSSQEQERVAYQKWIDANNKCASFTRDRYAGMPGLDKARILVHRLLGGVNPTEILPRHSSGAVAEGSNPRTGYPADRRWQYSAPWGRKLDSYYPQSEYEYVSLNHLVDEVGKDDEWAPQYARLAFVPKDARGPRGICCEHAGSQFIQQGLMTLLQDVISRARIRDLDSPGAPMRHVNVGEYIPLSKQEDMCELAWAGSLGGHLSTLDLEQASDSVPFGLVEYLFPAHWVDAFRAVRADHVVGIDNQHHQLHMAFPMGSSSCFPVESLCFWSICKAAGVAHSKVWAYGDDLIVETADSRRCIKLLELCGFTVNQSKSFVSGPFRESCGKDYLFGENVRPIFLRRMPTQPLGHGPYAAWASLMSFVNQLEERYPSVPVCSVTLRDIVDKWFGRLPVLINSTFAYHRFESRNAHLLKRRWNRDLQRYEYHWFSVRPRREKRVHGWRGVLKALLSNPNEATPTGTIRFDAGITRAWIAEW